MSVLSNHGQIKIGSTLYSPMSIIPSFESLVSDNSGRADDGTMHIEWIKRKIRKFEITMPPMTPTEAQALLALVQGQEYTLTVFDISTNSEQNVSVYTSGSKAQCYSGVLNSNGLWTGLTFTATEM